VLSLQGALKVDGFTVFRDVTWTADGGVASAVFWVLPPTPSLHRDPTGRPSIHLTRYLAAPDAVELARGLLLVTVDLGWTEAQDQALRRALAESLPDSGLDEQTLDLRWVPARGGRATLSVFGEVSGGDLVVGGGGPHPLSGVGDHTQSFLVELNADGSALLWTALEQGLAVVHVSYELELEHRLQDVSMRVWCDASGLSDELLSEEDFDPLVLLEARSLAGVELLEDGVELDEGTRSALIDLGRNTLATFLDGPARASDHAVLDLHWTSDQVLSTTVGVSGLLELGLEGSPLEGHRTEVPYDAGFFRTVELGVLVQPFEATSPVHSAEVRVSYASSGGASAMQSFTYGPTGGSDLFRAAWDSSE